MYLILTGYPSHPWCSDFFYCHHQYLLHRKWRTHSRTRQSLWWYATRSAGVCRLSIVAVCATFLCLPLLWLNQLPTFRIACLSGWRRSRGKVLPAHVLRHRHRHTRRRLHSRTTVIGYITRLRSGLGGCWTGDGLVLVPAR